MTRGGRKEWDMRVVDLKAMDLVHGYYEGDPSVRFRANFALFGGNGAEGSSLVYVELDPGMALGEHTDSPEEVLLVLEGEVEITVGQERGRATAGSVAVVPSMVPHGFRNVGHGTARVAGFFPSRGVAATFTEPVQPMGERLLVFGEAEVPAIAGD
jgi:quercetin dioxygenase-like cupin family protein